MGVYLDKSNRPHAIEVFKFQYYGPKKNILFVCCDCLKAQNFLKIFPFQNCFRFSDPIFRYGVMFYASTCVAGLRCRLRSQPNTCGGDSCHFPPCSPPPPLSLSRNLRPSTTSKVAKAGASFRWLAGWARTGGTEGGYIIKRCD